ncbi:4-carboxy muconolactone decarboxylase [Nocardia terpenica]|uniref:4-carboxy muconolactone decarboxylase n=2 Tax=Nocardia terpenica TaxID=455432 RepID=A0A291RS11_9NOCA|nr:4-carboxy muconolactone decarboxylase [Nocardia terpenica]
MIAMARIPYRDARTLSDESREFIARRGDLNVFRLLSNADDIFRGWAGWVDALFDADGIAPQLRELVILRVGHLQQSGYVVAQHEDAARRLRIPERLLAAVRTGGDLGKAGFDVIELAVLRLVTELLETKHVAAKTFAAVRSALGDEATVELLLWVHLYSGLALVLNAAEVEIDATARFRPTDDA